MSIPYTAGTSLLEVIVALVLLEFLAVATLHSVLHTQRLARTIAATGAVDIARLESVRVAAAHPGCRDAAVPTLVPLALDAAPRRPAITVLLRCGR